MVRIIRDVYKSEENARAQTRRKVTIAIAYRQTKPRNSNVDIIRYDRKFPVRSIDRLIKTEKNLPSKWNFTILVKYIVNGAAETTLKDVFFYLNFIRYFIQK